VTAARKPEAWDKNKYDCRMHGWLTNQFMVNQFNEWPSNVLVKLLTAILKNHI